MKRIILIAVALFTLKVYGSNFVYIPDSIFRNYINSIAPGAIVGDSMDITNAVVTTIDSVNITGLGISSIEGIEYFDSLKDLCASNNLLSSLPTLPAGVLHLDIDSNILYALTVFPAGLTQLYCNSCSLFQISALPANLQILDCRNNKLLCLPGLPDTLVTLLAGQNYMTCIPNLPTALGFTSDIGTTLCGAGICNRYDSISGYAFMDLNNNGIWDPGEPALGNQPLTMTPLLSVTVTDSNGYYSFAGHPGIAETIRPDSLAYAVFAPESINVLLNNPSADTTNLNFGFHYVDTFSDVRVFVTEVIRAIPGQGVEYSLALDNHGARTESGTLIFIFNSNFTYTSSSPAAILSGDTLIWNFNNLLPGVSDDYTIIMTCLNSAVPGTVFHDTAYVSYAIPDSAPGNNVAVITDTIVNAYQRNNKTVSPQNYNGANFQAGDYFDYNITFQNTDTDTVTHVWIIDTLSPYFDMSTLYVVAASAPYVLTISANALRVDFYNINLPDSAANQVGSHGFFDFLIRPLAVTYLGYIQNMAYIYLERNGVIQVDTAGTGTDVCLSQLNIFVYTNPDSFPDCMQQVLGSARAVVTSGTGPFTYFWSNGDSLLNTGESANTITNLTYGQYYVTVTDQCFTTAIGMPYVDSVRYAQILLTVTDSAATCSNGNNGVAAVTACGGEGPLSYIWSNGDTGAEVNNLAPGIYYCTVTDSDGISATVEVNIGFLDSVTINLTSSNCGSDGYYTFAGNASVNPQGYPPFSIEWSTGDTTSQINSLADGTYWVTVTDSLGCSTIDSLTIYTLDEIQWSFSFTGNPPCTDSDYMEVDFYVGGVDAVQYNNDGYIIPLNRTWIYPTSALISNNNPLFIQVYIIDNGNYCEWDTFIYPPVVNLTTYITNNYNTPNCVDSSTDLVAIPQSDLSNWPGYPPYYDYETFTYNWNNGTTGQNDFVPPGFVSCTVTDNYGCSASGTYSVVGTDSINIISTNVENVTCYGVSNGSISISVEDPGKIDYYIWNGVLQGPEDNNLSAGSYICQIVDEYGCFLNQYFTITQPDSLSSSAIVQNTGCRDVATGSIQLIVTGGTPGYTYQWSNNEYSSDDTLLTPGSYSCTVSDANNCTLVDTFTLAQTAIDSLAVSVLGIQNVSCNAGSNGSISLLAYNGAGNYIYNWSNSGQSATDTALVAGAYTCTITDSSGCSVRSTDTVTQPMPILPDASVSPILCYGGTSNITLSLSGGTPPFSFTGLNNFTQPAGTYIINITDSNGCMAGDTVVITQPDSLSSPAIVQNSGCVNVGIGSIQLIVTGGTPGYTYQWSNDEYSADDTMLTPGSYSCTISDANNCMLIDAFAVGQTIVDSLAVSAVAIQNVSCNGGSNGSIELLAYNGFGNYLYSWSNSQQSATDTALAAGIYACTIIDSLGCSVQSTDTVSQPMPILPDISASGILCYGDSSNISLSVSGGTPPYSFIGLNSFSLPAGIYVINIYDSNGCTVADTLVIAQPDSLSASANIQNAGCSASIVGSIQLTASGGTPGYIYQWSNEEYSSDDTLLLPGSYSCTVSDANNCTLSDSFTVVTVPDDFLSVSVLGIQNVSCNGGNDGGIELSAYAGIGGYYYRWSNGAMTADNLELVAGLYTCSITDSVGCSVQSSDTITQPPPIVVNNSTTPIDCYGGTSTISVNVSGGTPPYSYTGLQNFTQPAGNYIVNIIDLNGCRMADTIVITQPPEIGAIVDSFQNVSCYGDSNGNIIVSATGGVGGYRYDWSNDAGDSVNTMLAAGSYICSIADANGCLITDTFTVAQPNPLNAFFTLHESNCGASTGFIQLDSADGGTEPYALQWSNGDSGTNIINLRAGVYYLTITDKNGCQYTYSDTITCVTAIAAVEADEDISVYPNPASTVLNIVTSGNDNYQLQLRDITGRLVMQLYFAQSMVLDVANLPRGVYLAEVRSRNNEQAAVKKIVLQ